MSDSNIISLKDVLEQKLRKEQELEYYEQQLIDLQKKMFFVKNQQSFLAFTRNVLPVKKKEKKTVLL